VGYIRALPLAGYPSSWRPYCASNPLMGAPQRNGFPHRNRAFPAVVKSDFTL